MHDESLIEIFLNQQINDAFSDLESDKQYNECGQEESKLINIIKDLLPREQKHFVIELNDLSNFRSAISEDDKYKQGFLNGIKVCLEIYKKIS